MIIDVGNPQLSMHSIREVGGVDDVKNGTDLLKVNYYITKKKQLLTVSLYRHSLSYSLLLTHESLLINKKNREKIDKFKLVSCCQLLYLRNVLMIIHFSYFFFFCALLFLIFLNFFFFFFFLTFSRHSF